MIKTKTAVSYDLINPSLTSIVFAKINQTIRNDDAETYTLSVEEWVEIPYSLEVPNSTGEMELQNFITKKTVRSHIRVMSFTDSDQLTNNLEQMFTITETGAFRRKKYTELGHLVINNLEGVRGAEWELA